MLIVLCGDDTVFTVACCLGCCVLWHGGMRTAPPPNHFSNPVKCCYGCPHRIIVTISSPLYSPYRGKVPLRPVNNAVGAADPGGGELCYRWVVS